MLAAARLMIPSVAGRPPPAAPVAPVPVAPAFVRHGDPDEPRAAPDRAAAVPPGDGDERADVRVGIDRVRAEPAVPDAGWPAAGLAFPPQPVTRRSRARMCSRLRRAISSRPGA